MTDLTSLHIAETHIRLIGFAQKGGRWIIQQCDDWAIDSPIDVLNLDPSDLASKLPDQRDTLVITLSGGLFHIQRVPLEVAAEPDRQLQIHWEASQVLIDDIDNYIIDFQPAGRIAFWTAIRATVTQSLTAYFSELGYEHVHFKTEPLALYELSHKVSKAAQGALWVGNSWWSFIAHSNQHLNTAETISLHNTSANDARNLAQLKHWVTGDLTPERRKQSLDKILLCGETNSIGNLSQALSAFKGTNVQTAQPFELADFTFLPTCQTPTPEEAQSFTLALGAALSELT